MSQNYTVAEAAEYLRCRPHFLEENLKKLPHQRMGRAISFDESELEAIKDMFRVRPKRAQTSATTAPASLTLASIRPSKQTQRTG
ncbi:helix-turn-helix domain-containing protein [Streptomyces sp. NBC_01237]|uniref:helix-turn-helix domain-containing protein n=1 Tax=Streptomyces sp. NBC_01237 TaxID=2903790 RepID=UPI002DDA6432|nr:helix-turn-helix domain-containing protein [Streptomyces sp. NBC_01237]WRZ72847.1 helix-turn-helix domain-containing protein [Streptomyces sp. NBC_01237]